MKNKSLKHVITSKDSSIKGVMRLIDLSGLRVAYIVDEKQKLIGAVSDSEIRKAVLKGMDIKQPVSQIINPRPVVLKKKDLSNLTQVKKTVKKLLDRMADSRYILILDARGRPKRLAVVAQLLSGEETVGKEDKSVHRKVLVVGGAGYLGSMLVRQLLRKGFRVKVLDLLMYGDDSIRDLIEDRNFEFVQGDMRNISTLVQVLADVDVVINLAAIVGDPACKNRPKTAIETNFLANKALAEACKYHQVNRFMFASTCSVYGTMDGDEELDENSPLNPVSLYARSKIQSEEGILELEDENFAPTILRMATLYGYSPRMRFDLVVNTMVKTAIVNKKISVHGGGKQWRPLIHVEDAATAFVKCLEAPLKSIKGEVFNVGSSNQNYRVIDIARAVNKCVPQASLIVEEGSDDLRNYSVSFSKIERKLKYKAVNDLEEAILRIKKAIADKEIKDVNNSKYYNTDFNNE